MADVCTGNRINGQRSRRSNPSKDTYQPLGQVGGGALVGIKTIYSRKKLTDIENDVSYDWSPPASDSAVGAYNLRTRSIRTHHALTRDVLTCFTVVSKPLGSRFFYLFPLLGRRRLVVFVKVVVRVQRRETATRARHQSLYGSLTERLHVQDRPQGCQHFPQSADEIDTGNDRRTRSHGGGTAAAGGHDDSLQLPLCRAQDGRRRGSEAKVFLIRLMRQRPRTRFWRRKNRRDSCVDRASDEKRTTSKCPRISRLTAYHDRHDVWTTTNCTRPWRSLFIARRTAAAPANVWYQVSAHWTR